MRQPRYVRLFALMVVVALVCIGAGTWQIVRFEQKVRDNNALTANAKNTPKPLDDVLPLVGSPSPSRDSIEFQTVTATGHYLPSDQALVRLRSVNGVQGFYVLVPFVTGKATLLLVRGFVAADSSGNAPTNVAAAPSGTVTVKARAQTPESGNDKPGGLPAGQLQKINPTLQAKRLGTAVYDGWAQLLANQPGTKGVTVIPNPDLSNPAGGAVEPQHFAYIIQWYLFAGLALAAPFALARAERRDRDKHADDDEISSGPQPEPELDEEERRAAKLADRYGGRPVH